MSEIRDMCQRILRLSEKQRSDELNDDLLRLTRLRQEIEKLGYAFTSEIKISSRRGELVISADLRSYTSKYRTRLVN